MVYAQVYLHYHAEILTSILKVTREKLDLFFLIIHVFISLLLGL